MMTIKNVNRFIASAILCFGFFAFNSLHAQTWTGAANCYTIVAVTPPPAAPQCNQNCGGPSGAACNNCKQFTMTNWSNCWITELTIACTTSGGCFSICCPPALGAPVEGTCDSGPYGTSPQVVGNVKHFAGGIGLAPGGGVGSTATFSICYSGTGPLTFWMFDENSADNCCVFVPGTPTNYYSYTF
jgi:hypothetical protein